MHPITKFRFLAMEMDSPASEHLERVVQEQACSNTPMGQLWINSQATSSFQIMEIIESRSLMLRANCCTFWGVMVLVLVSFKIHGESHWIHALAACWWL